MRSGMRSWSKWVIFSRRMKSSSSVGPRSPALSDALVVADRHALVRRQRAAGRVGTHAVERADRLVRPDHRRPAADLLGALRLLHRARADDGIRWLDRLALPRRDRRIGVVLGWLVGVERHRRRGRLCARSLGRKVVAPIGAGAAAAGPATVARLLGSTGRTCWGLGRRVLGIDVHWLGRDGNRGVDTRETAMAMPSRPSLPAQSDVVDVCGAASRGGVASSTSRTLRPSASGVKGFCRNASVADSSPCRTTASSV